MPNQPIPGHAADIATWTTDPAAHADHLIALRDGRVLAQGSVAEIITESVLSELYQVEVSVIEHRGARVAVYYR